MSVRAAGVIRGARHLRVAPRAVLVALLCAVLATCLGGCAASGTGTSSSAESGSSTTETQKVTVSVLSSGQLSGPLSELEALYASEHEGVSFTQDTGTTTEALSEQLGDNAAQVGAAAGTGSTSSSESASASSSASSASSSAGSTETGTAPVPYALVCGMGADTVSSAVQNGLLDATSFSDIVGDTLVIAAGAKGTAKTVTTNTLVAGGYPVLLAQKTTTLGALQYQALASLGAVDASGALTGALAQTGAVTTEDSLSAVMQALSEDTGKTVSIVAASDVYRYGGVKIVGQVPASAYTQPLYTAALSTYATEAQRQAAQEFLDWCLTDADAQRIWEKWGFQLAA